MYPSGSLYTSNYSNRTLGVGRSQQGHDIFSTKPGIVSIPPRLHFPIHLPKTNILTNYLISFFPSLHFKTIVVFFFFYDHPNRVQSIQALKTLPVPLPLPPDALSASPTVLLAPRPKTMPTPCPTR